jgi:hypothetical protein
VVRFLDQSNDSLVLSNFDTKVSGYNGSEDEECPHL